MVRWELYVNFFYSWIIFSLRCHQVEFSVLHWNEYSSQSYSFWKTCREKDKKPWTPFLPPLHAALKHAQLPWVTKAPHSIHVLLGMGLELARCPLMWDWGVTTNVRVLGVEGCRNNENSEGQPWCSPQGDEGTWAHDGQSKQLLGGWTVTKQLWTAVTRTAVSSPPALKKPTDFQENGQNGINEWVKWCGYWTGGRKFMKKEWNVGYVTAVTAQFCAFKNLIDKME